MQYINVKTEALSVCPEMDKAYKVLMLNRLF